MLIVAFLVASNAQSQDVGRQPWTLELEYQRFRLDRNTVQKPNTYEGTRFESTDFTGDMGNSVRLTGFAPLGWWKTGDALRVVVAPLNISGTGISSTAINYYGRTFQAGIPITVNYRFNTYRFSYVVPIFTASREAGWDFRLGGTLGIRDAQIKLSQGGLSRDFSNVGPIPLLYASATKTLGRDWSLQGEFDGFPAPGGGGLFDGSLKIGYKVTPNLELTAGIRYQAGAAIDTEIYNSLQQTAVVIGMRGILW